MANFDLATLRRVWLNIHLWIGVGLALLLIPISISGGLLVWHDEIDTFINPHRYAVSGPQIAQSPTFYVARATEAVASDPSDLRPTSVRLSDSGWPIRVTARAHNVEPGARPRIVTVFLDPPTGKILDVLEFRSSLFGFLHVFHENLTIPEYSGRQIVGWAGVGMLILSLSGIYLWWPRNSGFFGGFRRGLRWSRSTRLTFNLHHLIGLWISIPLAVVSATGIYLSFPQTARSFMTSVSTMNPQGPRGFGGQVSKQNGLSIDRVAEIAASQQPDAKVATIFLPVSQRGEAGGRGGANWRVQMQRGDNENALTVLIDDRTGVAATAPAPASGDRAASWIRWIHEGSHSGIIWQILVFLTGVAPTIFAVTGVMMWLRRRAARKSSKRGSRTTILHPAE